MQSRSHNVGSSVIESVSSAGVAARQLVRGNHTCSASNELAPGIKAAAFYAFSRCIPVSSGNCACSCNGVSAHTLHNVFSSSDWGVTGMQSDDTQLRATGNLEWWGDQHHRDSTISVPRLDMTTASVVDLPGGRDGNGNGVFMPANLVVLAGGVPSWQASGSSSEFDRYCDLRSFRFYELSELAHSSFTALVIGRPTLPVDVPRECSQLSTGRLRCEQQQKRRESRRYTGHIQRII